MSRLFHSLVVCGAGLTLLSCGGRSASGGQDVEPARGGTPSDGGSSSGAGGAGPPGSAGSVVLVTGGAPSNSAGASTTGGTATTLVPGPLLPGAEGQWVCGVGELGSCSTGLLDGREVSGFGIMSACLADPARPKNSADCTGLSKLSCSIGFFDEQAVLFNCRCAVVTANDGCPCPDTVIGCHGSRGADYCDELRAYCGCALTCIAPK